MSVSEKCRAIMNYFERMGGRGTIADARRAVGPDCRYADWLIKRLIKARFVQKLGRNDYALV